MKVVCVDSVIYGVEELGDARRYFEDWGLKGVDSGDGAVEFTLPSDQTIRIAPASERSLPVAVEPNSTVREVVWGVDDAATLDEIEAELSRDREVVRDVADTLHALDPNGFGIAFRVSRSTIEPPSPPMSSAGGEARRANPRRISHVVHNVPKDRMEETAGFYMDRLGFRLTDRVLDTGDFLRCPGAFDHHNLFLMHKPNRLGFNHVAFELADIDEVMAGGRHMVNQGWTTAIEPGEHFLSGQHYWYFRCPCGGNTEYFAATLVLDDTWKSRIVETTPG